MSQQNLHPTSAGGGHEIATRIDHEDLSGRLRRGLEVRPGTRALLFVGGRYAGTLAPGRHTLDGVRQKLELRGEGRAAAVVVDDGELGLELEVDGLRSADHHRVGLRAQASIRLAEPELFLANLFRDRPRFRVSDLAEVLQAEVRQTVGEMVATHSAADLHHGRVRTAVEMELLSRWKSTFERNGFALQRLPVLDFELPAFDAAEGLRSEAAGSLVTGEAEREGRAAFFDAELEDLRLDVEIARRRGTLEGERERVGVDLEIDKIERDLDRLERRNPILERLLRGETMARMAQLENDEEWRKFKSRVDRQRLLDDAEWTEIQTAARLKVGEAEMEKLRRKLEELRLDTEVQKERAQNERVELQRELEGRRMVFDQEAAEQKARLELDREKHRSVADIQLEKIQRMEEIRQGGKDRAAARERQRLELLSTMSSDKILAVALERHPERSAEIRGALEAVQAGEATARDRELYDEMRTEVREVYERAQRLDHEKFLASVTATARHHESEKERVERVAVAGLTADDKKRVPWRRCPVHGIKHLAEEDCPLCARERSG